MYVQKPNCDHKEVIVSNPNGYDLTIEELIKKTNDPEILITALKNPNLKEWIFDCVISKLGFMATQGYARDGVVLKVLTVALEVQCLSKECLKTIEDCLIFMKQNNYVSNLVVDNISVAIEAKRAELSRGR